MKKFMLIAMCLVGSSAFAGNSGIGSSDSPANAGYIELEKGLRNFTALATTQRPDLPLKLVEDCSFDSIALAFKDDIALKKKIH